ncbi:MAG TPA: hypothetical protein EYN18_05745, partial [Nitrospirales bacterium]|nr:hypothetical protein [Nitrospirales bacterium]
MKPYLLAVMSLSALLLNSQLTQTPLMANLVKSNDPVATETSISVAELQYQINIERMRQHVYDLASPKMRGRDVGSDEGARAIAYIEDEFKAYGLKPWFGDDYLQPITTGAGANVAALLP